jgi:hypothetical protein
MPPTDRHPAAIGPMAASVRKFTVRPQRSRVR